MANIAYGLEEFGGFRNREFLPQSSVVPSPISQVLAMLPMYVCMHMHLYYFALAGLLLLLAYMQCCLVL